MVRTVITLSAVVAVFACSISTLYALPNYDPTIPTGYWAETVLRVNYGKSFGEVGVSWGSDDSGNSDDTEREYSQPACVEQMNVIGDRFYFYDNTDSKIKLFQSPGKCIWESSEFGNLLHYTVSPKGLVYVVWGGGQDQLSCIDNAGKTLWTKKESDIWPKEEYQKYCFDEIIHWDDIIWTSYGLTASLCVSPKGCGQTYYLFALTDDGCVSQLLSYDYCFVGPDGGLYKTENWQSKQLQRMAIKKNKVGEKLREIPFEFDADNGKRLAGKEMRMSRLKPDASGDFFVEGKAFLDPVYTANSALRNTLEEVLWRFDNQGKFKEQWRFLVSRFKHLGPEIVVGSDGGIYHLQFNATGIEVVKYSRGAK